jgi:RES domain-containing protein
MATYRALTGTFTRNTQRADSFDFTGTLYRCIPHSSQTPLSTQFAFLAGGRWNSAGSFAVLYTCASVQVARSFVDSKARMYGIPWDDRSEEDQPDLLVLNTNATLADVATATGLATYGLPDTYPAGYPESSYPTTQAIGQTIFNTAAAGLVTRSATLNTWVGQMALWAEVAIFTDHSPSPQVTDRIAYAEWYSNE